VDHHRDGEDDGRLFGRTRRSAVMIMGEGAAARDVPGCIVTVSAETPDQAAAAAARQGDGVKSKYVGR
jgi:hypothetical protein